MCPYLNVGTGLCRCSTQAVGSCGAVQSLQSLEEDDEANDDTGSDVTPQASVERRRWAPGRRSERVGGSSEDEESVSSSSGSSSSSEDEGNEQEERENDKDRANPITPNGKQSADVGDANKETGGVCTSVAGEKITDSHHDDRERSARWRAESDDSSSGRSSSGTSGSGSESDSDSSASNSSSGGDSSSSSGSSSDGKPGYGRGRRGDGRREDKKGNSGGAVDQPESLNKVRC